jgi:hypothetical protein
MKLPRHIEQKDKDSVSKSRIPCACDEKTDEFGIMPNKSGYAIKN